MVRALLTTLSLPLCVAAGVLWGRGYPRKKGAGLDSRNAHVTVFPRGGLYAARGARRPEPA